MKDFVKFLFASCLGTILALTVGFFLLFSIASIFSSKDTSIGSDGVLLLEFEGLIPEKTANVQRGQFDFESKKAIGVHRITKLIKKAQSDKSIKGIVYKASPFSSGGMVTNASLRDALQTFKDSTDKFVYSYGDFYSNSTYLLATAADSIFVNPNGSVDINGYSTAIPFLKEGLDKLGVKMEVFYAGNFKSATEPFRRYEMSPENKIQTRAYLMDYYNSFLDEITEHRAVSREDLKSVIDDIEFNNLDDCLEKNIVDSKAYWYEVEDKIRDLLDIDDGKAINYVSLQEYDSKKYISSGSSSNKVAVVYAEGEIKYDVKEKGSVSEEIYHEIFDDLRKSNNVKAVVLRVNSPGGSAFTSDAIWREMKELQSRGIPLVASFGDYAASGGYYIAARADKIVAHPNTLTGSIGVFSMLINAKEMMNDKLGIAFDSVKTSPHAIPFSPFFDLSPSQKQALQKSTDDLYQKFLSRVAEGRGMTIDEVHEVAQGRVWTGKRAKEIGLVDELGDLNDAIQLAAELANIEDDYKVTEFPKIKKEFWEEFIEQMAAQETASMSLSAKEKQFLKYYQDYRNLLSYDEPMARLPFQIVCE